MTSPPADAAEQAERAEQQFTAMYNDCYAFVLRFVRRRAHPLNVDDIVSETFTAAWVRRSELPHPVLPWLYRTARNAMLNANRGGKRQQAVAIRLASQPAPFSSSNVDELEWRLDFDAAFASLSQRDQELLAPAAAWRSCSTPPAQTPRLTTL